MKRYALRSALAGGTVWALLLAAVLAGFVDLGVMEVLVLLAPLVVTPLGFALLSESEPPRFLRSAVEMQPVAAILAVAAYIVRPGDLAAALAVPWCVLTIVAAVGGLARLRRSLAEGIPSLLASVGLFFLPVGGFMMVVNRLGIDFMGFTEPIILLTAVHFHYTGFATLLLASLAGRSARGVLLYVAGALLVAGPPALAMGFMFSPALQVAAALGIVVGTLALALLQLRVLPGLRARGARDLLMLSSGAVAAGMILAGVYSVGEFLETEWIDIPSMAWSHGLLNGLGFVGCGMAAWLVESRLAAKS